MEPNANIDTIDESFKSYWWTEIDLEANCLEEK
jgi:hypothetical protein